MPAAGDATGLCYTKPCEVPQPIASFWLQCKLPRLCVVPGSGPLQPPRWVWAAVKVLAPREGEKDLGSIIISRCEKHRNREALVVRYPITGQPILHYADMNNPLTIHQSVVQLKFAAQVQLGT